MTKIAGSTFWITGASSGIGEALSKLINQKGGNVVISSRRKDELERVKSECERPESIHVVPIDLSDPNGIDEAWSEIKKLGLDVDVLVNNAGISQRSLVVETDSTINRKIMEVNFFSAIHLTKLVLGDFLKRKSGHIVVISSLVGKFGTPKRSAYAASKHALHGFFESLRAEIWRDNINVTIVCPGFVKTQVSVNALMGGGDRHNIMDENQKQGKSPEECAKAIIRAIEGNKKEILFGGKEVIAAYLKRFFPNLLWRIVKKMKVA